MICLLIKPWPPSQLVLILIFTYFIKVCWWSGYRKQHIYGCIFHITTNHLIRINKIVWFASLFDLTIYFSCPIWWNEKVHKCVGVFFYKIQFNFFLFKFTVKLIITQKMKCTWIYLSHMIHITITCTC